MIRADKPELEQIIRDAADGLIAQSWRMDNYRARNAALTERIQFDDRYIGGLTEELHAARSELATATETEWRLCWWSSLAGCGVTLAGLWLGGLL